MRFISKRRSFPSQSAGSPIIVSKRRKLLELFSPAQMQAVMRRERARCDRQKGVFSIVLLRLVDVTDARSLNRLAKHVLRLVRETDEIGFIDSETLGVVLPDTDAMGASLFTHRTIRAVRHEKHKPSCVIYTYPDPALSNDQDNNASPGNSDRTTGGALSGGSNSGVGGRAADALVDHAPRNGHPRQLHSDVGSGVDEAVTHSSQYDQPLNDSGSLDVPVLGMHTMFAQHVPIWKRFIDLTVAGGGLLVASPILIAIALAIKMFDPGPIFFKQLRTGLGGRPFKIFKFRTMIVNAEKFRDQLKQASEQDGPAFKMKKDPRVTRVGAFLRKTSLDELPQLINVLKGDMTLVGPRPLPIKEAAECTGWYSRRHDVTPGLTCIWQVEGRSRVKFEEWMRMDMSYVRSRSPFNDIMIMLKTVPAVLLRRGAQ
jgi:lipopolysaccharide/colanic/teichoic acid biosynthesis glycosyltransferase